MSKEQILQRYELGEMIGEDLVSQEFKGRDRQEDRMVMVKLLKADVCQHSSEGLYRYRKLMRELVGIRHPELCTIYDYVECNGRDYVVTQWEKCELLSNMQAGTWSVERSLCTVQALSRGLDMAHQHGILHGLLNPESVLIRFNDKTPIVKVTNFGLGLLLDLTHIHTKKDIRRIFGYLAPEQSGILRKPIDARSDIYSLGILFYELLVGAPPYESEDINELISEHIAHEPARLHDRNTAVTEILERIVFKLIAKDPEDRYQTLAGLSADLDEYQRMQKEGVPQIEFEVGRNDRALKLSFATRLIGREAELDRLRSRLWELKKNKGSICFISGEPGSGKTRMLNELRADVHRLGGLFISGKCYQYESGSPFKALSTALESYVEKVRRLNPADREKCIDHLKQTVGDLGNEIVKLTPRIKVLLGEPAELAELESEKQQVRFLVTAANFLSELGRDSQPVVMLLEDLQWSDEGTIELLQRVATKLKERAMCVIITYRSNEINGDHPLSRFLETLKKSELRFEDIRIPPFDLKQTEEMISRVLLEPVDRIAPMAEVLYSRTRGNPFFVLELLRTLVEQKIIQSDSGRYRYDLELLKGFTLPENIVEAVLNRIKDLPQGEVEILSYAAVIGCQVDVQLLSNLTGRSLEDLLGVVESGIRCQILMRDLGSHETIQFVHDRIREAFYRRVNDSEAVGLHHQIAQALERMHPEAVGSVIYDLAHHYTKAGVQNKALVYSLKAAKRSADALANALAINLYENARKILEAQGLTDGAEYIDILEQLGELYRLSGKFDPAIKALRRCEELVSKKDSLHLAKVLAKLADSYFEKGEPAMSTLLIENALRALGLSLPHGKMGLAWRTFIELIKQLYHIVRPSWLARGFPKATLSEETQFRMMSRLIYIYYFCDMRKLFFYYLYNLNLLENRTPSLALARHYILSGPVWNGVPWFWKALRDLEMGLHLARQFNDPIQEGRAYTFLSFTARVMNRPKQGLEYTKKAIQKLKGAGEFYDLGVAYVFRNQCNWMFTPLNKCIEENREFIAVAEDAHILQPLGWAYYDMGFFVGPKGEVSDKDIEMIREGHRIGIQLNDMPDVLFALASLAFAYLRRGNHAQALSMVREIEELLPKYQLMSCWIFELFPICAQVYLETITHDSSLQKETATFYLKQAQWFCKQGFRRARRYKYIVGWMHQVQGTCLWLKGRHIAALRIWEEGVLYLREHENPYRLGSLLLEMAKRRLQKDPHDPKAQECLVEAKDLFARTDAMKDLKETIELLKKTGSWKMDIDSRETLTLRRHLNSLLAVTQAIGSVFDQEDLLKRIVVYAMKVTGSERGFILLNSEKDDKLELKVGRGLDEKLRKQAFSFEGCGISLSLIETVRSRQEAMIAGAKDGGKIGSELSLYGVKQAMGVLLRTKEKVLGILYLDNHLAEGMFGEEELELMKSFGTQATVAIENAHLVQGLVEQDRLKQEMKLGQEIQRGFQPKQAPQTKGLQVAAYMQPAREIGGDYYDYLLRPSETGESRLGVVIGDVTGKGVGAGLNMAMVKTTLMTLSQEPIGLKEILVKANRILHGQMSFGTFISLLYLQWDPTNRSLIYCGAGQGEFLVYRAQTQQIEIVKCGGTALGLLPVMDERTQEKTLPVEPGDKIILFTDGVTEAPNEHDEQFGLERLRLSVAQHGKKPLNRVVEGIRDDIYAFMGNTEQYDDITLIVINVVTTNL